MKNTILSKSSQVAILKFYIRRAKKKKGKIEDVIVSTTNTLEGFEISDYLGVVSANIVLGANIFSDLFASVTDVVGGKSDSYGNVLESSHREAMEKLVNNAANKGANALLGVSIDHDHISGQGKSMFMVNAFGTAVRYKTNDTDKVADELLEKHDKAITYTYLNYLTKIKIASAIKENPDDINLADLSLDEILFIADNHLGNRLKNPILKFIKNIDVNDEISEDVVMEIIDGIKKEEKIDFLYQLIDDADKDSYEFFVNIVKVNHLLSFDKVKQLLMSNHSLNIMKALYLLKCDKEFYVNDDVAQMKEIIDIINSSDLIKSIIAKIETEDLWECSSCGTKDNARDLCSKCHKPRDVYEKKKIFIEKEMIINKLEEKVNKLETYLSFNEIPLS